MKKTHIVFTVLLLMLTQTLNSAYAQYTPNNLEDLVNIRASSGEEALKARGYEMKTMKEGTDQKWSYWWNAKKKECITVVTKDGRYASITGTGSSDCSTEVIHTGNLSGKLPPDEVADLVDIRASAGESSLQDKGFHLISLHKGDDRTYGYWWNTKSQECICVITKDGRYASLDFASAVDCNQQHVVNKQETTPEQAEVKKKKGAGTGVAIAAVAAAAIGAAILINKSHNHKDNKHYDDYNLEQAFERGYRDGLYNNSYHNYGNNSEESNAYSDGYNSGVNDRRYESQYHSNYGGYSNYVNVTDLQGKSASWAEQQFYNRGFKMVDSYYANGQNHSFFYNRNTNQCIEAMLNDNGYYSTVRKASNKNCHD